MIAVILGIGGLTVMLLWVRRTFSVVRVAGESMLPAFSPGTMVLIRRSGVARLRVGDVVVLRSMVAFPEVDRPGHRVVPTWIIKRIAALPGHAVPRSVPIAEDRVPRGSIVLLGDNPSVSSDSRQVGYYSSREIRGKVVRRLDSPFWNSFNMSDNSS